MRSFWTVLHFIVLFLLRSSYALSRTQGFHSLSTDTIYKSSKPTSNIVSAILKPLCTPQNQEPGLDIVSAYCYCAQGADVTISLPEITPTPAPALNDPLVSCAYRSIPVSKVDLRAKIKMLTNTDYSLV